MQNKSPARILQDKRGKAPAGQKFISSSVYFPAGPFYNVRGTYVRNPLVAKQINEMHEKIHGN